MGMRQQQGFTIIEVVLFLAITGLLAVGLLGGWTTMIDTQRYKDSVKTLQSFLQQQYNLVYNVQNGRDATTGCSTSGSGPIFSEDAFASADNPGQSDCIVMGRYIHVNGGTNIDVYPILGNDGNNSANVGNGDVWLIRARHPKIAQGRVALSESKLSIPWDAEVVDPNGSTTQANYAIVIIRSPETGAVHTYAQRQSNASSMPQAEDLIGVGANSDTNLCLNPNSALIGYRMGVVVRANASSQSSVQVLTDDGGVC